MSFKSDSNNFRLKGILQSRLRTLTQKHDVEVIHKPKGTSLTRLDLIKLLGLLVFVAIVIGVAIYLWPFVSNLNTQQGRQELVTHIKQAGPFGVVMLLALQLLQIIVAVIPGEVVQLVAGMIYGPFFGTLIILAGCVLSSALLYQLVHRLGAPFVHAMIPEKWIKKLNSFETSEKLDITVFLLFLIPGMPKDVLTYIVPLTNMPFVRFLVLSNVARIPGVLMSTLFADSLTDGNIIKSITIAAVVTIFTVIGIFWRERLMSLFDKDN
ncbi:MAG: TVP38/TMEM64 family protein [Eggerthellaceae bacterium]|nr:TVP38/TMEM64 family protein [Eggerthellaceae bacterium]